MPSEWAVTSTLTLTGRGGEPVPWAAADVDPG